MYIILDIQKQKRVRWDLEQDSESIKQPNDELQQKMSEFKFTIPTKLAMLKQELYP